MLLSHFGSLSAVKAATLEELTALPGINEETARNLINHFHKDKI
jgi:excinuclease UvrABC nuclease subunit